MKFYRILLPVVFGFVVYCSQPADNTISEIKRLEYLRDANPDKFIVWLNSENPNIRLKAVEALGKIQDKSSIPWVGNRLGDADPRVRSAAAFAIGQFFSPQAEQIVSDAIVYEADKQTKARLITALGKDGTDKSFHFMRDFVETNNRDFQKAATVACGILSYRGFTPFSVLQSLGILVQTNRDADVRWRSAYALYRAGSPTEIKSLFKAVDDPDSFTRFFALRGLRVIASVMRTPQYQSYKNSEIMKDAAELTHSDDFYDKISLAAKDSLWYVRVAALKLMGNLRSRYYLPALKNALNDPHPHVRQTSFESLSNYRTVPASVFLEFINNCGDWRSAGFALENLAKVHPAKALRIIKQSIDKLGWPENYFHISALKTIGGKEANVLLLKLADGDNLPQVSCVLDAPVDRFKPPTPFLLKKLQYNDPSITTIVATHFAFRKDPRVVPYLLKAYQHFRAPRDIEPMESILVALDSIRSREAVPLLETELSNPFPTIRFRAREALERITGKTYQLPKAEKQPLTRFDFPPLDPSSHPKIKLHTSKGDIVLVLYPGKAPVTCANFVQLVKQGFYNGLYFHRVVPGFVVQGGDPRGDGWGGPGYTIPCEYNDLFYDRGVVGMAHAGKDTGGSQFFITHTPQPHLNGRHTAFGRVISGMKVVDSIEMFDKIEQAELLDD